MAPPVPQTSRLRRSPTLHKITNRPRQWYPGKKLRTSFTCSKDMTGWVSRSTGWPKKTAHYILLSISLLNIDRFLADRTIGRAFGTMCRLSSVCLSSVLSVACDVLYCGKTVRLREKLSEGVNRKPGSKS